MGHVQFGRMYTALHSDEEAPLSGGGSPLEERVQGPDEADVETLRDRVRYLEAVIDHSADVIITTDRNSRIVEFNRGAERLLGWTREEAIGKPAATIWLEPDERHRVMSVVQQRGSVVDYETRILTKSGRVVELSVTLSLLRNEAGEVIGTVGVSKDIRRRKKLERQLKKLAITDALTGLFNRAHFNARIAEEAGRAARQRRPLSLLLFDLDGFGEFNDRFGHLGGDGVLRRVGRIVLRSLRRHVDTAYRYGGDEFVVVLPDVGLDRAERIAGRLLEMIAHGVGPAVGASIGVAELRPEEAVVEFVKRTDQAMYRAKSQGGRRVST